jgi:hypothetical protein
MSVKLLMSWDISAGQENEYSEFVVNEFIPRIQRLGMGDIEFWYTRYGECKQIQASGISPSLEQMNNILTSREWRQLQQRLAEYVQGYEQKLIRASQGFQI